MAAQLHAGHLMRLILNNCSFDEIEEVLTNGLYDIGEPGPRA